MSHLRMDHLEGLELSEVNQHLAVAPARLSPLALRYALTGLHPACDLPLPMAMYDRATHGHWAHMMGICYGYHVASMSGTHKPCTYPWHHAHTVHSPMTRLLTLP